jgi:hypothetical protein
MLYVNIIPLLRSFGEILLSKISFSYKNLAITAIYIVLSALSVLNTLRGTIVYFYCILVVIYLSCVLTSWLYS